MRKYLVKAALVLATLPCSLQAISQQPEQSSDSLPSLYIQDHKKQLNVKFEVENELTKLQFEEDDERIKLEPNLNLRYALVFSYKFLSIRIGIRPKISDTEEKERGDSNTFRLRLQLLFDNWSHLIEYNSVEGYYVTNTEEIQPSFDGYFIQYPDLQTRVLSGFTAYKLNRNYSFRSMQSQTEIQIKSAGSFMPGVQYRFYTLTGTDRVIAPDGTVVQRSDFKEYKGVNLAVAASYWYNFVWKRHWYLSAFATLSAGYDFYETTFYEQDLVLERSFKDPFTAFELGLGAGYNGTRFFFGARYRSYQSLDKFDASEAQLQAQRDVFSVFAGYRFKAPKPITKPVDLIEEKVPILQPK